MKLSILPERFTVCKLPEGERMPQEKWCFTGITHRERSLVCPTAIVPAHTLAREDGWRGFYVDEGTLDFSLIGILAEISRVLAQAKVGIFVVSTFDTDYIFVKEQQLDKAILSLSEAGYEISEHKSL